MAGAAAAAYLFGSPFPAKAQSTASDFPELVAVKGGKPAAMFDAAIAAAGGMGRFVAKGDTVLVKPNIGWDVAPGLAATTDPALVARIVEHCLASGARKVLVFDNSCDAWKACYKNSLIESAAKNAGATVLPAHAETYFQATSVPGASTLITMKVHEAVLEARVFINVPVLKNHGGAGMTGAMKNLMGTVWDRGFWHASGLDRCISEAPLFRKPDLNVVDAYRCMASGGPRGNASSRYLDPKMLLLSPDIVAVDTAGARIMGIDAASIGYLGFAGRLRLGNPKLESVSTKRISL